jgi:ABC-2 type transport system ATP-binding protein
MLSIQNITFSYGEKPVLKEVSLSVASGTIHGVLGMNGAGKTTLFNTIYGLLKPQSGQVIYGSEPLQSKQIAYLETHNFFYSYMRAKEYLQLCAGQNKAFRIEEWNELFQLPMDALIDTFSTGMRKKLAFMGILALDRDILILDEPFNGVDLESNEILYQILLRLKQSGKTIILSSHIMETLTNICDEISYLFDGTFQHMYGKTEFPKMEEQLRGQLLKKTSKVLDQLMDN